LLNGIKAHITTEKPTPPPLSRPRTPPETPTLPEPTSQRILRVASIYPPVLIFLTFGIQPVGLENWNWESDITGLEKLSLKKSYHWNWN